MVSVATSPAAPSMLSETSSATSDKVPDAYVVETESQKRIVVGAGGALIKEIGMRARQEIEALLGNQIFLELRVKVRQGWRQRPDELRRLGI